MSLRGFATGLLVALVGLGALAFGSVEGWASAALRLGLIVVAIALVLDRRPSGPPAAARALLLPLAALCVLALLQTVPIPDAVARLASPRWASLRPTLVPSGGPSGLPALLEERAKAGGATAAPGAAPLTAPVPAGVGSGEHALSVASTTTRRAVLAWITAGLALACAATLAIHPVERYRLLWGLALWTGALGAIALFARLSGTTRLLWIREAPLDAEVLGPFVNPNHFAAFVEIGTLVALGLLLALLGGPEGTVSRSSIRKAVVDRSWAFPRLLVLGGCAVLGAIGLVLSGSRAGILAFAVGLAALLAARRLKGWLVVGIVLAVCLGLAVGVASWAGGEGRALKPSPYKSGSLDPSFAMRWDIWGRTLTIIRDFPVTGSGLGTFGYVYAIYDRPGEWLETDQAHNDYLQIVAETGLAGAVLLLWALVVLTRRVLRPAVRHRSGFRWTSAACVSAVFAIALHAIFEFGLQIPAVAVEFAVTLGILTAVASDGGADAGPEAA
ncbi:MAG TPA: O-antigen ligase family protein [Candidatus Polarisedimenticolaceae bacterium]|nr:O-antigen ligase family protein [Candidatus Polarisedimenticolaceae bacterium]